MESFLTVLAWIFGVISVLQILSGILLKIAYVDSLDYHLDAMAGKAVNPSFKGPLFLAIICFTWIFTR